MSKQAADSHKKAAEHHECFGPVLSIARQVTCELGFDGLMQWPPSSAMRHPNPLGGPPWFWHGNDCWTAVGEAGHSATRELGILVSRQIKGPVPSGAEP